MDRRAKAVTYRIGGTNVRFTCDLDDGFIVDPAPDMFETEGTPDASVEVVSGVFPSVHPGEMVYHTEAGAEFTHGVYRHNGDLVVSFKIPDDVHVWPFDSWTCGMLTLRDRKPEVTVHLIPERVESIADVRPLRRPLATMVILHILYPMEAMLLHACGVDDHGKGYAFIGPSGSGKSTLAQIWSCSSGASILSDELVVVRRLADELMMYGTPWSSSALLAKQGKCRLEKLFFIEHSVSNLLMPISSQEVLEILIRGSYVQWWHSSRTLSNLRLIAHMADTLDCFRLGVVPNSDIVDFVRQVI
jgi:hypothetical protein